MIDEKPDALLGYVISDKYRLLAVVGRGGMATVYAAQQLNVPRRVAIKVSDPGLAQQATFVERFRREVAATARLEHEPHILPVYDVGEEDHLLYVVMPLISGGTLRDKLDRDQSQPWTPRQALLLSTQVLAALQYAHERGFVHRDVKPSNILLEQERAYLADFGIAKAIQDSTSEETGSSRGFSLTGSIIVGTPSYMAPEQALGYPVDPRADIYSFGIVLYQLLTGAVPYEGVTPQEVQYKHIEGRLRRPRELNPRLSEDLEHVVMTALRREPEYRYASAAEFSKALEVAVQGTPLESGEPPRRDPDRTVLAQQPQAAARRQLLSRRMVMIGIAATAAIATTGVFVRGRLPTNHGPQTVPDMVTARSLFTLTQLANGDLLAAGGQKKADTYVAATERFDAASNRWLAVGNMASPRAGHTATVLKSGNVLVAGGQSATGASGFTASAEQFDSSVNQWRLIDPMVSPRLLHNAVALEDGRVLVLGGFSGDAYLNSAEVFDPGQSRWLTASSMASARVAAASIVLTNGDVLAIGGYDGNTYLATAERYDPNTDTWVAAGQMTIPRAWHTATALADGRVLVNGGYVMADQRTPTFFSAAEIYDPNTNQWRAAGSMASPRTAHTATLLANGQVLVVGGQNRFPLDSVELFDPMSLTWSQASQMASPRTQHQAALQANGQVIVTGGQTNSDNSDSTASCDRYDPVLDAWSVASAIELHAARATSESPVQSVFEAHIG